MSELAGSIKKKKKMNWRRMQRGSVEVEWCNSEEGWWYNGCLGMHPTRDQNF